MTAWSRTTPLIHTWHTWCQGWNRLLPHLGMRPSVTCGCTQQAAVAHCQAVCPIGAFRAWACTASLFNILRV